MCGMDRTFISMLERGLRQPTLSSILTIAKALNVRSSKLVNAVEKELEKLVSKPSEVLKVSDTF